MTQAPAAQPAGASGSPPRGQTLIPLIVGIVGKRELGEGAEAVESSLYRELRQLRRRFPRSPLWILSSVANGADWLGARAVARLSNEERRRAGPLVRLVCVLPFARSLYVQDFEGSLAEHKANLDRLLDRGEIETADGPVTLDRAALRVIELRPLVGADPASMTRVAGKSGPQRTIHYEQAGMLIADACHLLLAVLGETAAAGRPERVGGTTRIVRYKGTGALPTEPTDPAFDELIAGIETSPAAARLPPPRAAHDVDTHRLRRLSLELPEPAEATQWFTGRCGHVWLLTAGGSWQHMEGGEATGRGKVFAILQPFEEFNRRVGRAYATGRLEGRYRSEDQLAQSLDGAGFAKSTSEAERAAVLHLSLLRGVIATLQDNAKRRAGLVLWAIAVLFVLSVAAFTAYKIWHSAGFGYAYLFFLALATGAYVTSRWRNWSAIHDDYRAVAEALRTQRGWRLAGIRERAEWHYRAGTTLQLERVRRGIETVNWLIALEHRDAEIAITTPCIHLARQHWVEEQISFFRRSLGERERHNARFGLAIFAFFYLGIGAFAALAARDAAAWPILVAARQWTGQWIEPLKEGALVAVAALALAAFALRFSHALLARAEEGPIRRRLLAWTDRGKRALDALARTWPLPSAPLRLLYPVLWALAPVLAGYWIAAVVLGSAPPADGGHDPAGQWVGFAIAVLNAVAAAAIYLREKLAVEPEERNYEEMAHVFAHADRLLARTASPEWQQRILLELGKEALGENAYWLRAHRERPIEQIPG